MGRIGISYQDVNKAITELQGKQKNPTVDNIREVLGTGSKSTIAKFLREWKAKHGLQNTDDGSIPSELLSIVKGLWDRLQEKSTSVVSEYQREFEDKLVQLQQQLTQSKKQEATLQAKTHNYEEELHQQKGINNKLNEALTVEQKEKLKMGERITSLESRRQENIAENAKLHQLLKHVQNNLEHYQTSTQELRQEQSLLLEKQRNEYEHRILELQKKLEVLIGKNSSVEVKYQILLQENKKLSTERTAIITASKDAQNKNDAVNIAYEKLKQDYDQIKERAQRQAQEIEAKQHTLTEVQIQLKTCNEKITVLEASLAEADDKIQNLRHDYQFSIQEKANLAGQVEQLQNILSIKEVETT